MQATIYPILREHFRRDEFLGRINEILLFLPFTDAELEAIVEKELQRWQKKALETHSMHLDWTKDVVRQLIKSYNVRYGARSIKNEVERKVVNQVVSICMDPLADIGFPVVWNCPPLVRMFSLLPRWLVPMKWMPSVKEPKCCSCWRMVRFVSRFSKLHPAAKNPLDCSICGSSSGVDVTRSEYEWNVR